MVVRVDWQDADQQSVRYVFEGNWDWAELHEAFKQGRGIERSLGRRLDVILQVRADATPALNICSGHYVTNNDFVHALLQQHLR